MYTNHQLVFQPYFLQPFNLQSCLILTPLSQTCEPHFKASIYALTQVPYISLFLPYSSYYYKLNVITYMVIEFMVLFFF